MPGKPGQPTKYYGVKDVLLPALREGMPKRQACALCGISKTALYEWIEKGEAGEEGYIEIADAIKAAQAEFVQEGLKKIKKQGESQWTAWAWMFERMFPEEFGKLDKIALTNPKGDKEAKIIYLPEEEKDDSI